MLVRREDFAAVRVNWRPKSENLKEIAQELNIGLDSLVFFDDNPVERAEVRDRVPEVLVVEVPRDPALYVDTLSEIPHFDMTALTAEDRIRARSYQQQVERKISEQGSASLEDFLVSLEMVAEIGPLDGTTAQRIGQLVGKTNQFNLTTRRHTQAELEALAASDDAEVHWVRLKDRYGDMGLIAVGVLLRQGRDAVVDSLVLSCRAANRGIEQTLLSFLTRRARALGCDVLVGEYLPTERNHVVEDLYPRLGFEPCPEGGAGARYRLDLSRATVETPDFMVVTEPRA
jgi:FkbH-like protein